MKKLKAIILTASLLLASCAGKQVPIDYLYTIDTDHNRCGKYKIINKKSLEVDPKGQSLPLSDCNGFISVDREEYKKFQSWLKDLLDYGKKKAGRAKVEVYSQDLKEDFEAIEKMQ